MTRSRRARRWSTLLGMAGLLGCELLLGPNAPRTPLAGETSSSSGGVLTGPDGGVIEPAESVVRRLSQAELDNTLRDVLLDDARPALRFLSEDVFTPYDNDYTTQRVSQSLIDSLEALATDVAARTLADPIKRGLVVPCVPTGPGDEACFRTTVQTLGQRLFRRPLTEEEITPYLSLLAYATEDNPHVENDFYTAVDLLLRALLQDPEFLYRIEIGAPAGPPGVVRLTPYEIATRMAYLLWGTTPDDALLEDAASGALSTLEGRRTAALRMLEDERAREQVHRFHAMWLGYRTMPHEASLVGALRRETHALLDRVIFEENRNYLDVFSLDETYVDDFLATHYGLDAPAGGAGWVAYGSSGRAGILSHGSVLSAFNKFTDTSPTQRGIMVNTRLLCTTISSPPPDVQVDQPPGGGTAVCKEDRYREHTQVGSCAACHDTMDPIGFGLENYDMAGRYRTHDDGMPECIIRGQGALPGYGGFSGPRELSEKLLASGLLQRCMVQQFSSFTLGRPVRDHEQPDVDALAAAFEADGFNLKELILDTVSREQFALKKEEVTP